MEKEEKFDQVKYILDWQKKNITQVKFNLRKDYVEKLNEVTKKLGITRAEFFRNAIDEKLSELTKK